MNKRMTEIEELRANGDLPRNVDEELCDEYDDLSQTFNQLGKLGDQVDLTPENMRFMVDDGWSRVERKP